MRRKGTWEDVGRARRYPRYEVNATADITGNELLLYHPIRDLSLGGMRVETASRQPVGAELRIVLNFPEPAEEVALSGEVVWSDERQTHEVGVAWEMNPDVMARLTHCIERSRTRQLSGADDVSE